MTLRGPRDHREKRGGNESWWRCVPEVDAEQSIALLRAESIGHVFGVPQDGQWYEVRGWVKLSKEGVEGIADTAVYRAALEEKNAEE